MIKRFRFTTIKSSLFREDLGGYQLFSDSKIETHPLPLPKHGGEKRVVLQVGVSTPTKKFNSFLTVRNPNLADRFYFSKSNYLTTLAFQLLIFCLFFKEFKKTVL